MEITMKPIKVNGAVIEPPEGYTHLLVDGAKVYATSSSKPVVRLFFTGHKPDWREIEPSCEVLIFDECLNHLQTTESDNKRK